jgi:hypothetical protein
MDFDRHARGFARALLSNGPSPVLGERASDLTWLVGSWLLGAEFFLKRRDESDG